MDGVYIHNRQYEGTEIQVMKDDQLIYVWQKPDFGRMKLLFVTSLESPSSLPIGNLELITWASFALY